MGTTRPGHTTRLQNRNEIPKNPRPTSRIRALVLLVSTNLNRVKFQLALFGVMAISLSYLFSFGGSGGVHRRRLLTDQERREIDGLFKDKDNGLHFLQYDDESNLRFTFRKGEKTPILNEEEAIQYLNDYK